MNGQVGNTFVLALVLAIAVLVTMRCTAFAESRTPQFPLKTGRTIYTDKVIQRIRHNVATYTTAKAIADNTVSAADLWLEWDDQALRDWIPTAQVPRAFNVGTAGCPTCGKAIYEKGGTYPWKLDAHNFFKVECPVCGGVFPDNDFEAYYRSGFKDERFLEGEYADDGWGWVGPDGERYWFVAYANHWGWRRFILGAVDNLSRAYVITGDPRYAHKTAIMLDRIAEVYPDMDYHWQSRYGQLQEARGSKYHGKILNWIWETGVLQELAEAYECVWETIDGDAELHALTRKTGEEIRANIEANLLEEGIDAYFEGKIRGNFGMHQRALVFAGLVRQHGPLDEWFDGLMNRTDDSPLHTGLNYALYNLVYRDGVPYETSPGYNFSWVANLTTVADTLSLAGLDAFAIPKMRRLYDGVLDVVNAQQFTPSVGDSGSVYGGLVGRDAHVFQTAYRAYHDPRYLNHLASFDATQENSFKNFRSLAYEPVPHADPVPMPQRSRLLDGYGMGILCNENDTVSVALYYGYKGGHGHFDRLNIDLFALGQPMTPDTGYPDFMNAYVPGIYTWSKNTITHNAVTVDASRQVDNEAGVVHLFADSPFARVIDVDAAETYPQCTVYRRHLVMIDLDQDRSYLVDFFTVEGGSQHDYSLHGPPGTCAIEGGEWEAQERGTLAGEDVPIGHMYDDEERSREGFDGTYYGYSGSGFQHLFNVQRLKGGAWLAEYSHEKDPDARLRLRVLGEDDAETIAADAQVSPVKHKQLLRYLIARRQGENLRSRFVGVMEPYRGDASIAEVKRIDLDEGATAVSVRHEDGSTDVILHNPGRANVSVEQFDLATDALSAVVRLSRDGAPARVFFASGRSLSVGGQVFEAPDSPSGTVASVTPQEQQVRVRLDRTLPAAQDALALGRVVHFENNLRRTAHPVSSARLEGDELVIAVRDDLLTGRARIGAVEAQALRTPTSFMFAPVYRGAYASDTAFKAFCRVADAVPRTEDEQAAIRLAGPLPDGHPFVEGGDAWIVNVGPGDRLDVPAQMYWESQE